MSSPTDVAPPVPSRKHGGKVHHWATVWLGTPTVKGDRPGTYWTLDNPEEVEVCVQDYGEQRWAEKLHHGLVDAAWDILNSLNERYSAVRLRTHIHFTEAGIPEQVSIQYVARRRAAGRPEAVEAT